MLFICQESFVLSIANFFIPFILTITLLHRVTIRFVARPRPPAGSNASGGAAASRPGNASGGAAASRPGNRNSPLRSALRSPSSRRSGSSRSPPSGSSSRGGSGRRTGGGSSSGGDGDNEPIVID